MLIVTARCQVTNQLETIVTLALDLCHEGSSVFFPPLYWPSPKEEPHWIKLRTYAAHPPVSLSHQPDASESKFKF